MTALDFGLRLERRLASSAEYYQNRALGAAVDPTHAARTGRLVLLGSPLRPRGVILDELRPLLATPVGVIATASAEPEAVARETVAMLERHGIPAVALDASRDRLRSEQARRALVERIGGLGSFLITGGNQRRFLRSDIRRLSFILIAQRLGLGLQ